MNLDKRVYIAALALIIIGTVAVAQSGNPTMITGMMGYKKGPSHSGGLMVAFVILKLIALAIASFVFSAVFWLTHKWIMCPKKKK